MRRFFKAAGTVSDLGEEGKIWGSELTKEVPSFGKTWMEFVCICGTSYQTDRLTSGLQCKRSSMGSLLPKLCRI